MVAYELSLIVKGLSKAKIAAPVKRTAEFILSCRGHLEKIEFLGTRQLPLRIGSHGQTHYRGSYFLIHCHAPYEYLDNIKDHCARDTDIIRRLILRKEIPEKFICTLHEETMPPADRAEVQKMIGEAEERIPRGLKMRRNREAELKDYKF